MDPELSNCSAFVCKERIIENKYPRGISLQTTAVSKLTPPYTQSSVTYGFLCFHEMRNPPKMLYINFYIKAQSLATMTTGINWTTKCWTVCKSFTFCVEKTIIVSWLYDNQFHQGAIIGALTRHRTAACMSQNSYHPGIENLNSPQLLVSVATFLIWKKS